MKILDLFSGIGGFSLGLERAGMETVAFCEIDKDCHKVLMKNWPNVPIYNDVCKLKKKELIKSHGNIDLICGGFPCQDISVAGKQKGIKDGTRSGLWKEFKRLIKEIKPRYVIIENVANLRSMGLNEVIKDLWSIGYACEWHIISARSVGACHLRERIWIIAYPDSDKLRKQPGRSSREGWKEKTFTRKLSEDGELIDADPDNNRCNGRLQLEKSREAKNGGGDEIPIERVCDLSFDSNLPRLWRAFTSEEESSRWWTEATSRFSAVFEKINEIEPTVCRGYDGVSDRLDERARKARIKQLGNAVVPQIPELIGREILNYENSKKRNQ